MAYASASGVSNYCRNILGYDITFTSSTSPNLNAVNTWLSSGCSIIETKLSSKKYSVPVGSTATAYGMVQDLNTLYAAAWVEMSRTNTTLSTQERTRGQVFLEEFYRQLDELCEMDLTGAGLSRSTAGVVYAGGIYTSEKSRIENDSSYVKSRFSRGQFRFPGTLSPTGTTASEP